MSWHLFLNRIGKIFQRDFQKAHVDATFCKGTANSSEKAYWHQLDSAIEILVFPLGQTGTLPDGYPPFSYAR
jgi:hypothetical protein